MNKDKFMGKWRELKGKVKEKWGKLTDDDISQINGKWDQLTGKLQQRYGWNKEHAEREMNDWCSFCEREEARRGKNEEEQSQWDSNRETEENIDREKWRHNPENEKKSHGKDEDKKRRAG